MTAAGLVGAAVGSAIAALITANQPPQGRAGAATPPAAVPAAVPAAALPVDARAAHRCQHCGVIESMQRAPECAGQPASYVFTVRMRDGSLRAAQDAEAGSWQVGDRIQLMGGTPAAPPGAAPAADEACAPQAQAR